MLRIVARVVHETVNPPPFSSLTFMITSMEMVTVCAILLVFSNWTEEWTSPSIFHYGGDVGVGGEDIPCCIHQCFFTLRMSKEEVNNNNKEEKILWMLINVDS